MPRKASELNQSILPFLFFFSSFPFFLFFPPFFLSIPGPRRKRHLACSACTSPFEMPTAPSTRLFIVLGHYLANCIALIRRRTPRFTWNATTLPIHITDRLLPRYGFSKSPAWSSSPRNQGWDRPWSLNFRASQLVPCTSLFFFFFFFFFFWIIWLTGHSKRRWRDLIETILAFAKCCAWKLELWLVRQVDCNSVVRHRLRRLEFYTPSNVCECLTIRWK